MDKITQLIRDEIKRQYRSLKQFSDASGIPYSTLSNALTRGVGSMSYDSVVKICNLLGLKQAYDTDLTIFNEQFNEICTLLEDLDEQGVHTVKTVLQVEHDRCTKGSKTPRLKSFNGIAIASEELNIDTQNRVKALLKQSAAKSDGR